MIVFFFCIFFFLSFGLSFADFNYQFLLEDNRINLSSITQENNYLSFSYKIDYPGEFLDDIPLFLLTFNDQVLFYQRSNLDKNIWHQEFINLEGLDLNNQLPFVYKNNYLNGLVVEFKDLEFIDSVQEEENQSKISNLSVIRESDHSLTIIFSVDQLNSFEKYYLLCLENRNELVLTKSDDFLFSELKFTSFYPNQNKELIFNIKNFDCQGDLAIYSKNLSGALSKISESSQIIDFSKL